MAKKPTPKARGAAGKSATKSNAAKPAKAKAAKPSVNTAAVVSALKSALSKGTPTRAVCEQFGIDRVKLHRIAKKAGLVMDRSERSKPVQAKVVQLTKKGQSAADIAQALKISRATVYRMLAGAGVPRKRESALSGKALEKAQALLAKGLTYRAIAEKVGVSFATVYRRLNR